MLEIGYCVQVGVIVYERPCENGAFVISRNCDCAVIGQGIFLKMVRESQGKSGNFFRPNQWQPCDTA